MITPESGKLILLDVDTGFVICEKYKTCKYASSVLM